MTVSLFFIKEIELDLSNVLAIAILAIGEIEESLEGDGTPKATTY